jgi:hypothetical protein
LVSLEFQYWKAVIGSSRKSAVPVLPYEPASRSLPERILPVFSAWQGLESVLSDLITRFNIGNKRCLEFGVERGYSTAALSSFFDSVIGVDTFIGDKHTGNRTDLYAETCDALSAFDNIRLMRSDYRDWIANDQTSYDLIHVDIIHTYVDTYRCGLWSAQHANCVLFHDTESFPAVKQAVTDIARESGKTFYNFKECYGLGILV